MLSQSTLNKIGLVPFGHSWLFIHSIQSGSTPNNIGLAYLDKDKGEVEEIWYNKFHLANHCKVWLASMGFELLTTITSNLEAAAIFAIVAEDGEEVEMELYGEDEPDVVFKAANKAALLIQAMDNKCEQ